MKQRLQRLLPTAESIRTNRWLRWLGPALRHPKIWHLSRRGIAMGLALGVFFGLLTPVAQIPLSVGAAVALRANVPVAVAGTLVSNPVTFAPLYYAAWRLGSAVLHEPIDGGFALPLHDGRGRPGLQGWLADLRDRLHEIGKPLFVGLALLASAVGLVTYFVSSWVWRARVVWQRRRRLRERAAGLAPSGPVGRM